jgi:hypothetical protein
MLLEETEVTLHDTVFWACADSMMKSGHSLFLVNCTQSNGETPVGADLGKIVEGRGHHYGVW